MYARAVALSVCALCVAAMLIIGTGDHGQKAEPISAQSSASPVDSPAPRMSSERQLSDDRIALEREHLRGRVVGSLGEVLDGALVTWTSLSIDVEKSVGLRDLPVTPDPWALTDATGSFLFAIHDLVLDDNASVLWATL